ncbi:MAG: HNH endonuclease signature motif containing protein [Actinomycetota bacterium]
MSTLTQEPTRFGDVLAHIGHEIRPHYSGRWHVRRCKHCEDRKPIPLWLRRMVYKRDHWRCVWCGTARNLTLDHRIPWSAGGPDTFDNLRTLCRRCNGIRSNTGRSADLWCVALGGGWDCVICAPELVAGEPNAEAIFCLTCETASNGLAINPGRVAHLRQAHLTHPETRHA